MSGYADAAFNSGLREAARVLAMCPTPDAPSVPLAPVGAGDVPLNDADIRVAWVNRVLSVVEDRRRRT